jgi:hypothetical protein
MMTVRTRIVHACLLAVLACAPAATAAAHVGGPVSSPARVTKLDLAAIRKATMRFQDVKVAESAGYSQFLECVSGPNGGAMGIHFANGALVGDGELDPLQPEALIYEPRGDRLQLVGLEYVVLADAWHAKNEMPPALMGQQLNYTPSPNRYGMPAHYEIHVWAWRNNPTGLLADWNPRVSCVE